MSDGQAKLAFARNHQGKGIKTESCSSGWPVSDSLDKVACGGLFLVLPASKDKWLVQMVGIIPFIH